MSDIGIPQLEEPFYQQLTEIRQYLSTLKKDRKNFIKSKDVLTTYDKVLSILNQLESTRTAQSGPEDTPALPNRVDYLIDDIFQLLSLCFMTVGLTQTAPLTYASLSTVQRLLEHLDESGVYTSWELKPILERLDKFSAIINQQDTRGSAEESKTSSELKLLTLKLNKCVQQYQRLVDRINQIPPELQDVLNRLVNIRRNLMNLITMEGEDPNVAELVKLQEELASLEESHDFSTLAGTGSSATGASSLVKGLLDDCHTLISDLSVAKIENQVDPSLQGLYNELIKIKVTLENLLVTRRWTLRETDLFNYQKGLQEIDNHREQGKFLNSANEAPERGQLILLYLLRRCYAIIYKLLESSEPISELLQPIHNQLSTVRRCLLDVKRMGGISSIRELYPYQLKLASIDNLRQDGKFMYDDQIPEGQGALNLLLLECFDIVHELKIEYYDLNENEADDDVGKRASGAIETTKSSEGAADLYDESDESDDEEDGDDNDDAKSDIDRSLLLTDDRRSGSAVGHDSDDLEAYDLPSYAASDVNESEIPTDVEK